MTDTPASYGRDVWMALAAIGWSDGHLDQNEADALVRTALDEGAELDEISDLDEATKKPITLGDIDLSKLTKEDRLFIYAVACWITRIDGKVTEPEVDSLNKLGELLRVPEKPRQHAENIVKEVSQTCVDIRPAFFNLSLIKSMISERLAEAKKIKEAMKTDGEEDNEKDEESEA
jgi:uncharacterized membrane protein YebE (DUF533 family)